MQFRFTTEKTISDELDRQRRIAQLFSIFEKEAIATPSPAKVWGVTTAEAAPTEAGELVVNHTPRQADRQTGGRL